MEIHREGVRIMGCWLVEIHREGVRIMGCWLVEIHREVRIMATG